MEFFSKVKKRPGTFISHSLVLAAKMAAEVVKKTFFAVTTTILQEPYSPIFSLYLCTTTFVATIGYNALTALQ